MGMFIELSVWIYILTCMSITKAEVILIGSPDDVFENIDVTLTCRYTGTLGALGYTWRRNDASVGLLEYNATSGGCTPFREPDTLIYKYSCPERNRIILSIINITKSNNGDKWTCSFILQPDNVRLSSNVYTILVQVPVTSVEITEPSSTTVTVKDSTDQIFKCRTSISRPTASIQWYLHDGTSTADTLVTNIIQQTPAPNETILEAVTGTLIYRPTRRVNGWKLYCSAQNITSHMKLLNITYPPNNTKIDIYVKDSTYYVIAGKQQTLICRAIDSNPLATLDWFCFTGTSTTSVSGTTVTSEWTWTTHTGGQCTCVSEHIYGNQSYSLNVEILATVDDVKFHINNKEVSGNVKVIHDSTVPIVCSASGSPNITYKWKGGPMEVTGNRLYPSNITQDRTYTCYAYYTLNPSQGQPETRSSTSSVDIIRLYGPVVLSMTNQSVEEGKPFRYTCPYTPGNPADTTVKWTRAVGNKMWNSETLEIVNVSKAHTMKYTCTVENTMEPTNLLPVTDPRSGYFYLDVTYKASIEEFVVEDHIGNEVTVEELTSPILVCKVDSYPASNLQVLFRNQMLVEYTNTLQLKYQLPHVSCGDIGVYTCAGRNYLNTQTPSTRDIVLFVNCPPQPYGYIAHKVYSALRKTATLSLSVLAYPVTPSVVWTKDDDDLKNNAKLTITMTLVHTSEIHIEIIQLHLIIRNVSLSDFGQYKVQIRNDAGMMEETFYLIEEEIVDPPGENIGLIIGVVVCGMVLSALVTLAVVYLIRRRRANDERNSDDHQPNACDQTDANKSTEDASNYNSASDQQVNDRSNNETTDHNYERFSEYEMVNQQNRNITTYSSLQSDNVDLTKGHLNENKTYENLKVEVL